MIQLTNSPYKYIFCAYLYYWTGTCISFAASHWQRRKGQHSGKSIGGWLVPFPHLSPFLLAFMTLNLPFPHCPNSGLNLALDSHWLLPWCTEQKWLRKKADTHKVAAGRAQKAPMTWSIGLPVLWLVVWPGCTRQAETNFPSLSQDDKGPQDLHPRSPEPLVTAMPMFRHRSPKQSRWWNRRKYSRSVSNNSMYYNLKININTHRYPV